VNVSVEPAPHVDTFNSPSAFSSQYVIPISRYIVVAVMLLRLLALARAPVELAEAEVAVGDELEDLHANFFVVPPGHLSFNFTSS
jgi:hypothetical protein